MNRLARWVWGGLVALALVGALALWLTWPMGPYIWQMGRYRAAKRALAEEVRAGRWDEAVARYEAILRRARAIDGIELDSARFRDLAGDPRRGRPYAPLAAYETAGLATALARAGHLAEAEAAYREAVAILDRTPGVETPDLRPLLTPWGVLYEDHCPTPALRCERGPVEVLRRMTELPLVATPPGTAAGD